MPFSEKMESKFLHCLINNYECDLGVADGVTSLSAGDAERGVAPGVRRNPSCRLVSSTAVSAFKNHDKLKLIKKLK